MEKYILELIKDNNRVIIPNFGAFIIAKEDGINILFNNFLSFNDGLLVNYVAKEKGVDTIQATDEVFNFVDNLKNELDQNGEYTIENLGTFKKDKNGVLRFQQADNIEASDTTESTETKETEEKEIIILDTEEEPEEIKEENTPQKEEEIDTSIKEEETIKQPVLTIEETEKKPEPAKDSPQPTSYKKPSPAPISNKKEPQTKSTKTEEIIKERKRKDIIIFSIIALVIIIGLAIFFIFFNKTKKPAPLPKPPVKVIPVDSTEIKRKDSIRIAKELEAAKLDSLKKVEEEKMAIEGKFHLIVGSFKVEDNAINMVKKLQEKGYNKAQYFTKGSLFFVSIDNNVKYGPIEASQQEVLSKERLDTWVYKAK